MRPTSRPRAPISRAASAGIGKSFFVDSALAGKQVRIDFDGVYMDATVWVNGTELGNHPYGYTPFSFDLTPYLKTGEGEYYRRQGQP